MLRERMHNPLLYVKNQASELLLFHTGPPITIDHADLNIVTFVMLSIHNAIRVAIKILRYVVLSKNYCFQMDIAMIISGRLARSSLEKHALQKGLIRQI